MSSARLPGEHPKTSVSDPPARPAWSSSTQHQRSEGNRQQSSDHTNSMDHRVFSSTPAGKVAIPPLHPRTDPNPTHVSLEKKRTSKACVECRSRKIKCSGKRPTCEHCEQCEIPCVYAEGKREQNKRASERSDRLLQILRDISREVYLPSHLVQKVQAVESEVWDDDVSVRSMQTTSTKRRRKSSSNITTEKRLRSRSPAGQQGEAEVSADVGSEDSVDLVAEDFNRTEKTRATGFIGKNSEVAWAQRLSQAQAKGRSSLGSRSGPYGKPGDTEEARQDRLAATVIRQASESKQAAPIADFTYHLDMEDVLTFEHVDKDELPPPDLAKKLLDCYMATVQDALPILTKSDFINQFQQYLRSTNPQGLPATWRALLNMVFAIGAKFSHLTNASWRGDERDHLIYYTRAMNLGLPGDAITSHPDLQRIQVLGLISFYYLAISQVSRSWIMIGLACRQAIGLGLHLRNMDPSSNAASKEKRVKVWWSLYYIEYLLCEITGRPTQIDRRFCSVPAPAPIDETNLAHYAGSRQLEEWNMSQGGTENSSTGSQQMSINLEATPNAANHFRCRAQLAVISQKILVNLYSANTVTKSWEGAQKEIVALGEEVDNWYRCLPLQFQFARSDNDKAFFRERILLGFSYYSTKILLNRPCLCRVDKRIQKQGEKSKNIDLERARECIMAARSMSDLLPDLAVPDVFWIYTNGPWWCIVHHLMQAMTVLMLELAFGLCHMTDPTSDQEAILHIARKILRWLTMMAAVGHEGARSACNQARDQFKGFAPFEKIDTSDLVQMAEQGPDLLREQMISDGQLDSRTDDQGRKLGGNPTNAKPGDMQDARPKVEQPSSTRDLKDTQDYITDNNIHHEDITGSQQSHPFGSNSLQQTSQEAWEDYNNDQLWHNRQWDLFSSPTWNTSVFQTSYDMSNPFTSFEAPYALNYSTADSSLTLPHHVTSMSASAYLSQHASSHQGESGVEPSGFTMTENQQQDGQTTNLGENINSYPTSSHRQNQYQHPYQ